MLTGFAPFPWKEVLGFAMGVLRWPPEAVWSATPREIALALGSGPSVPAPRRADLDALMRLYPDGTLP